MSVVILSFAQTDEYLNAGIKKILKQIINKILIFLFLYFSLKATKKNIRDYHRYEANN